MRPRRYRVGWVASDTLQASRVSFDALSDAVRMRIANVARWIERNTEDIRCELYRRRRSYDVVVFQKAMSDDAIAEAGRLKERGTRVVFDANVNYYEIEGEYEIPGTKPTEEQRRQAIAMTTAADLVVADSTFLCGVARRFNASAVTVPDNVDLDVFSSVSGHESAGPFRVVWSGMAAKALPLLDIAEAVSALADSELVLVSERAPEVMEQLREGLTVRYVPWSLAGYARLLPSCDVIVSPKRLTNRYELGHTEWKITLGMACGLPAVASPQQSYVEALSDGGGFIAETADEWQGALARLAGDAGFRRSVGAAARATVERRYSTSVVAHLYLGVLRTLL